MLAVLRTFALQLEQHRLGHDVLLRGHQGLNQVGARRPMARIQLQRLKIKRDGVLMLPRLEVQIAEVAPAVRQMRRDLQRRLVVRRRRFEIAAEHAGIAELGVQLRNRLDGYRCPTLHTRPRQDRAETQRWPRRLCRHVMLQPEAQVLRERPSRRPASGKAMANAVAGMYFALFARGCRKDRFDLCQFLVNKVLPGQRWPDWKSVLRPLAARKGSGSRVICRAKFSPGYFLRPTISNTAPGLLSSNRRSKS